MSLPKKQERPFPSKQNEYVFAAPEGKNIVISSKFESGNIRLVRQSSTLSVAIHSFSTYWSRSVMSRARGA